MKPGQTALVRPGTYGRTGCERGEGRIRHGRICDPEGIPGSSGGRDCGGNSVVWIDCNYLRLQGFVIAGPSVVGGTNVYGYVGTHHVQIVGNEIRNSLCQGIYLEEQTDA